GEGTSSSRILVSHGEGHTSREFRLLLEEQAALVEHALVDDLVRPPQYRLRDRQAERLGCLEVDGQLELRGLLDGEIGGLGAFENLVYKLGDAAVQVREVHAVGHEPTSFHVLAEREAGGQPVL